MDFANISPPDSPSAWLDMDALDHNIRVVNQKTQSINLRIATKSIRSIDVLNYIKENTPNYIGLMSYNAAESLYLLQKGFTNILCAYPTLDRHSVSQTFEYTKQGATMIWMADRIEHLQLLNEVAKKQGVKVKVCFDINMSMSLPKLYFGTKRSSLMNKNDVKKLLKQSKSLSYLEFVGVMGYEAQIAGLAENIPGKTAVSPAIRLLKKRSKSQLSKRRNAVVNWLTNHGYPLELVNGGGSGSMDFTSSQPEVTEITVGSAYYKPAYFDYMDSMQELKPAAGFVLSVTRQPVKGVITCHSGGFVASGAFGVDKVPVVHYPKGLSILKDEGFGEVQTPMMVDTKIMEGGKLPNIGDLVWCRHAKAGELCEHFNELYAYRASDHRQAPKTTKQTTNQTTKQMVTYRGDGKCFH